MRALTKKWQLVGACGLLLLATSAVYWPVLRHGFVNFDDQDYLTQNLIVQAGLTWKGTVWAFTTSHAGNWHPLTWLSHMFDCQLFGLNAAGHHLTSLVFHAANAILLFLLLQSVTGGLWPSAVVAGLFALHPLHVESVAWASERKDVLSTFFFIITLWAYCAYARPGQPRNRQIGFYGAALACFALGLMCKPMLVTLPFLLLLLDYWPLGRLRFASSDKANATLSSGLALGKLLLEKAPFLALSAASSVITMIVQRRAMSSIDVLPLDSRIENVIASYLLYIAKLVWPTNLAPFYPFPAERPFGLVVFAAAFILTVSALAVAFARRTPYFIVGWFWYLGTLVPVIGIVQVGIQSMADRYTYIPSIGLFIALAWGLEAWVRPWRPAQWTAGTAAVAALAVCLALASIQVRYWRNSEALFRHTLQVTTNNSVAHHCLGCVLVEQGKFDEAEEHFAETVRLKPSHDEARNNLGLALVLKGRLDEAISHYEIVLEHHPGFEKTHYNLGRALELRGRREEALTHYARAVELAPDYQDARAELARLSGLLGKREEALSHYLILLKARPNDTDAHFNAATLAADSGQSELAIEQYRAALALKSDDAEAHERLGLLLAQKGQVDDALLHFIEVRRLRPDAPAYYHLGLAQVMKGHAKEAVASYRKALEYRPDWPAALNDLAWILATHPNAELRDGAEAVRLAEKACELTERREARFLGTLDAAYAEAGRFEEAARTAQRTRELAQASGLQQVAEAAEQRIPLYQQGKAYHQ